tara:strand:- start:21 stop:581 length:561 start_codon:yes stop_codon:yes gene_type:complete
LERNNIRSICVFCGSRYGNIQNYKEASEEIGKLIAKSNLRLVYGGGNVGLMGSVATAALEYDGDVLGVITKHLMLKEVGKTELKNLVKTEDMHTRKAILYRESDAFIIMPGGVGTLDEFFEILTWSQLELHEKKIVLLNIDNYWEPLIDLINHQIQHGFMESSIKKLFCVAPSPKKALNLALNLID